MHSSIVLALFAAGALAQPLEQRDVVVKTMTAFTTVTVGGSAPTAQAPAPASGGSDSSDGWTLVQPGNSGAKVGAKGKHGHAHVHAGSTGASASGKSDASSGDTGSLYASASGFYQQAVLLAHNYHRKNHSADPLEWDDAMASAAQQLANTCDFHHSTNGYGQNIAAGVTADQVTQAITDMFYNNEEPYFQGLYGQANPTANFESWGHFSQLVWKGTTGVGCATAHCPNGVREASGTYDFTVCNYSPAGNVGNEYANNIGEPIGLPTIDANWGLSQLQQ